MKKILIILMCLASVCSFAKDKKIKDREPSQTADFGKVMLKKNGVILAESYNDKSIDQDKISTELEQYTLTIENSEYSLKSILAHCSSGKFSDGQCFRVILTINDLAIQATLNKKPFDIKTNLHLQEFNERLREIRKKQ